MGLKEISTFLFPFVALIVAVLLVVNDFPSRAHWSTLSAVLENTLWSGSAAGRLREVDVAVEDEDVVVVDEEDAAVVEDDWENDNAEDEHADTVETVEVEVEDD